MVVETDFELAVAESILATNTACCPSVNLVWNGDSGTDPGGPIHDMRLIGKWRLSSKWSSPCAYGWPMNASNAGDHRARTDCSAARFRKASRARSVQARYLLDRDLGDVSAGNTTLPISPFGEKLSAVTAM